MAQSGFTPIQIYYSTTAGNVPLAGSLANGELAINTNDGVLYYKDSGGVVQVLASGSSISVSAVAVATTTNLASLSGLLTIDGVTLTANQRVLVKDQTLSQNNGVYVAAVGAWTRAIDANSSTEIASRIISVVSGSTNGGEQFATTFKSTDTLGTTAMAWFQVALQNTAVTFTDLTTTGNMIFGNADTDTITQSASYVTGTQLKSAKVATNTLSLAAYDVDGAAYTNLITLTASNTPTLTLTSTGVGTINNMSIGATTASTGAFTTLSSTGNTTLGDASADTVTINGTVQPGVVISGTSTGNALRVTQLGTGNALLVEDSANPDSTPFVIDSGGNTIVGSTASATNGLTGQLFQVQSSAAISGSGPLFAGWSSTQPNAVNIARSQSGTVGTSALVSSGASSSIRFFFDDGSTFVRAASIDAVVDGTPSTNDMPGRLVFSTTSDGASTPTERVRIDSTGQTKFSYNTVVEVTDATNAALRVTQLGAGNALLVEDSTNPDASPFVIDALGRVIQGYTTSILTADDYTGANRTLWGYQGNSTNPAGALFTSWNTGVTSGAGISLSRSKSATIGTQAIVSSGDSLGGIGFNGDDGTNFIAAASITAVVDGTPGTNDMPGRLVFNTTPDGSDTPVERVRITNAGDVGVGVTAPATKLDVLGTIQAAAAATQDAVRIAGRAGGTGSFSVTLTPTALTANRTLTLPDGDVTLPTGTYAVLGTAQTFTAAQTFQAANAVRSEAAATQDAIVLAGRAGGTGSFAATITTATLAASVTHTLPAITGTLATLANTSQTFTGSTSFVPATNSGTITIGAIPQTGTITVDRSQATHTLDVGVGPTLSGNTKTINFGTAGASGSTTNINIGSAVSGATTTTAVSGNFTVQGLTVGLGGGAATGNTAVGVLALDANTTGTYNTAVGHLALVSADGTNNTAVGSQSMRFLSTGSDNIAIGYASLYNGFTGNNNIAVGVTAMYNSTVTGSNNIAIGTNSGLNIDAGSFNTFVGTSSGQNVNTGSKNVIIGGYTGLAEPISQTGSNWIVLSDGDGNVRQSFDPSGNSQMRSGAAVVYCPAPSTITAAATLTNADIQAQIVNTTGTTYTLTMPLGTTLETLIPWSSVDLGYDFYVINTATGTITMAANTGVTFVGRLTVLTNIAGQFRIRRTAANTFIVYRIN